MYYYFFNTIQWLSSSNTVHAKFIWSQNKGQIETSNFKLLLFSLTCILDPKGSLDSNIIHFYYSLWSNSILIQF